LEKKQTLPKPENMASKHYFQIILLSPNVYPMFTSVT